ncbi:MAG TPA: LAGLIDADG family homing endonuclease [Steroidobacteraceae bacterium]|nr:LAGLIDADG family homing endonuclease [Steroidobacteraceae bacterium]
MKAVQLLSTADAAYLAGLIDGEGTIALSRRHADERRHLVVSISSTERELVDWTRRVTGVGKITRKRTVSPAHATGLTYSVSNRQALAVLRQVVPYLRSYKRDRARLVLRCYLQVTPRNGKYTNELAMRRCEFEDIFAAMTPRH